MNITYLGHGCIQVQLQEATLLFDPFITPNPLADKIDIKSLKPDFILVSHGHEDHVADVEAIAKNSNATVISNFEIVSWFGEKGIDGHPMNHGGSWTFDFGTVKMVNAVHSSVLPDGSYGGNPAGFVINSKEGAFYFAGDTALHQDMKLIPEFFDLNFAVLPIGDNFTMGIDEAVKAAQFVNTTTVIGMHYDTFPYIEIDKQEATDKFQTAGVNLMLLNIGKTNKIN